VGYDPLEPTREAGDKKMNKMMTSKKEFEKEF